MKDSNIKEIKFEFNDTTNLGNIKATIRTSDFNQEIINDIGYLLTSFALIADSDKTDKQDMIDSIYSEIIRLKCDFNNFLNNK